MLKAAANGTGTLVRAISKIWASSRRSAAIMEVVECGVSDSPMEGHESLWDVFFCWHSNFECACEKKMRNAISRLILTRINIAR